MSAPQLAVISTCFNNDPAIKDRHDTSIEFQTLIAKHTYIDAAQQTPSLGCLSNLVTAVNLLEPDIIVVWLDGDDWFTRNDALERVVKEYDKGAWMTWGQFIYWPQETPGWASDYDPIVHAAGDYREDVWRATHLKTFRAGLFHKIPWRYMLHGEVGKPPKPFTRAVDMAVMFPMLEMARERGHFIPDALVAYNTTNPLSAHNNPKIAVEEKAQTRIVRSLQPLPRLKERPW